MKKIALGNIIFIIIFIGFTAVLVHMAFKEGGGYIWTSIGMVVYTAMSIGSIIQNPTEDLGTNPSAGQAFLIFLLLGPLAVLLLIVMFFIILFHKKQESKNDTV